MLLDDGQERAGTGDVLRSSVACDGIRILLSEKTAWCGQCLQSAVGEDWVAFGAAVWSDWAEDWGYEKSAWPLIRWSLETVFGVGCRRRRAVGWSDSLERHEGGMSVGGNRLAAEVVVACDSVWSGLSEETGWCAECQSGATGLRIRSARRPPGSREMAAACDWFWREQSEATGLQIGGTRRPPGR